MKNNCTDYRPIFSTNPQVAEAIPIVGYLSKDTLILKNGELMQTLVIEDFRLMELEEHQDIHSINQAIINAIYHVFNSQDYIVYLHTVRSRRDVMSQSPLPFGFPDLLNQKWIKRNNWNQQLCNSIYISVIYKNPKFNISWLHATFASFIPHTIKENFFNKIHSYEQHLTDKMHALTENLMHFRGHKLQISTDDKNRVVGEHLAFFQKILAFKNYNILLPIRDLSEYLAHLKIRYHFNYLQINPEQKEERYIATFTVKNLYNTNPEILDGMLHAGNEMVFTQILYFTPPHIIEEELSGIKKMMNYGEDKELIEYSGFNYFIKHDKQQTNDFVAALNVITLSSDDWKLFNAKLDKFNTTASELGLSLIREDMFMSSVYFAQLPGNARYTPQRRLEYMPLKQAGQFLSIMHKHSGNFLGSVWGDPVTVVRSMTGTPVYINFHDHNGLGNTLVCGPYGSGKNTLIRFLTAQSLKFMPLVINLDCGRQDRNFFHEIDGITLKISQHEKSDICLYPFSLKCFNNKTNLYATWLHNAIYPETDDLPQFISFFNNVTNYLLDADPEISKLEILRAAVLKSEDGALIQGFNDFLGHTKAENLFALHSKEQENLKLLRSHDRINLDISDLLEDEKIFTAYYPILLYKIREILDGRPGIIILHNLANLLHNKVASPLFIDWLRYIRGKNAIAICSFDRDEELESSQEFTELLEYFGSKIFMSNRYADKYFRRAFNLSDYEFNQLKSFDAKRRIFLYKQEDLSVFLQLTLDSLEEEFEVLIAGAE